MRASERSPSLARRKFQKVPLAAFKILRRSARSLAGFSRLETYSRIFDAVSDNKWATPHEGRMSKVLKQLENSDNGSSCYLDNVPQSSKGESDEVNVFDENDFCKLNGQVNAAINSYARHHAFEGRVYRQIIRSARKVKNFFNQKNEC
ncbi:unnamed protein product [Oikopleura dioica]|uniref:Uncharacterized protein n=1 Tax=Oikopleura dioica TaxID=34765 RepID=E4WT61_OIKDI|nr:unnamed protein product [Oikopleura dioica]